MATPGKSRRPPPYQPPRPEREAAPTQLEALLARLAEAERARDAAQKRAASLETWTMELEAKVAAARTRCDEMEATALVDRRALVLARKELMAKASRVTALEDALATQKRDTEDALEVERVQRGMELEALRSQHATALRAARAETPGSAIAMARETMGKAAQLLESLARQETSASAARVRMMDEARRLLEPLASVPPAADAAHVALTMPPPGRAAKKRSRRPPAPVAAAPSNLAPATPSETLSFEDLDLGD